MSVHLGIEAVEAAGSGGVVARTMAAVARPLDAVRHTLWALTAKTWWGRRAVRDRGFRLGILTVAHLLVAFTFTLVAPVWLLLIGPLVLGAPHVVSDVRYLLLKPPVPLGRAGLWFILGPLMTMTALRVVAAAGGPFSSELEVALGGLAMLGGVLAVRGRVWVKVAVGGAVVTLAAIAMSAAYTSLVIMAHVHNAVAIGLWLYFSRGEIGGRALVFIGVLYVGLSAALFTPFAVDLALSHAVAGGVGSFTLDGLVETLAPSLTFETGLSVVMLFGFLQAMHYVIWLRLIPQRLDSRRAPPTFARSLSRLSQDFGGKAFVAIALVCLAIPVAALVGDPGDARHVYLLAAVSHGYIELAIIAALLAHRRAA